MSDFFFKSKEKEIRTPQDDPLRKQKEEKGRRRIESGQLTFESEGHRKDYERAINANPHNVMGLPEFYPPEILKATGFGEGFPAQKLPCGHSWTRIIYHEEKDRTITRIYRCREGHSYTHENETFTENK